MGTDETRAAMDEARVALAAHYPCRNCRSGQGASGQCPEAQGVYSDFLRAQALHHGYDQMRLPGVRRQERADGREPPPLGPIVAVPPSNEPTGTL